MKKVKKLRFFSGKFNSKELVSFITKFAHPVTEEDLQPKKKAKTKQPSPPQKESKLHHVTDQESFDSVCFQLGLCLITFLDPEAEEQQSFLDTLNEIVKKFPSVQTMWLDGNKHKDFKSAFGIAEGYPQAVAYQRKAKRYRIFTGGFDVELLSEFLELVQAGSKKGRISVLNEDPAVDDGKEEL